MKLELSQLIFKKYSTIKFHDIRNIGVELFHANEWTDMTKLIVRSS